MEKCDYCENWFDYELKEDGDSRKICGPCLHKLPEAQIKPGPPKEARFFGKPIPRKKRKENRAKDSRQLFFKQGTRQKTGLAPVAPTKRTAAFSGPPVNQVQLSILKEINERARKKSKAVRSNLLSALKRFGCDKKKLKKLMNHMRRSEMTINFMPFLNVEGKSLIDRYRTSDGYKNAFETGFSGGAKANFQDSNPRNQAEVILFGYPYFSNQARPPEAERAQRPKYIALNMFGYGTGAAARYGSCSLVLKEPGLKEYCTLTSEDSFGIKNVPDGPDWIGTFEHFENCLYYMATKGSGKKVNSRRFESWFPELLKQVAGSGRQATAEEEDYWEVQVHATVRYPDDIAYLRASFFWEFGAAYGDELRLWCRQNNWPLVWAFDKDQMILDPYINEALLNQVGKKGSTRSHVLEEFDRIWNLESNYFQKSQKKTGLAMPLERNETGKFKKVWITKHMPDKRKRWQELWKAMPISLRY